MLTITIIILAYIVHVFFTRFLNKIAVKNSEDAVSFPILWFIPGIGFLIFLIVCLVILFKVDKRSNWFTGKNW